jgi:hypothetical protein
MKNRQRIHVRQMSVVLAFQPRKPATSPGVVNHDQGADVMTQGDKSSFTDKLKRQAEHIEDSEKKAGKSAKDAERIAWAWVNKQDGGARKSGSGKSR